MMTVLETNYYNWKKMHVHPVVHLTVTADRLPDGSAHLPLECNTSGANSRKRSPVSFLFSTVMHQSTLINLL